jgi:DNA-binding NarL/FixJ family response regulator
MVGPGGATTSSPKDPSSGAGDVLTVVIVDDHALLRTGTRRILDEAEGFTVLGEAENGDEAVALATQLHPDILLVDIRLPGRNGIEVLRAVATTSPATRCIILSAYDDEAYVQAALGAGAAGYLLKTVPAADLIQAVRAAAAGVTVLDPAVSSRLTGQQETPRSPDREAVDRLTDREREVVRLVANGLANKAIALNLGISTRTVEGHLNHVFDKIGVGSRTEIVRFALTHGLADTDQPEERPAR